MANILAGSSLLWVHVASVFVVTAATLAVSSARLCGGVHTLHRTAGASLQLLRVRG
jgi:hypothetical protein